jgi:hypothetical protein
MTDYLDFTRGWKRTASGLWNPHLLARPTQGFTLIHTDGSTTTQRPPGILSSLGGPAAASRRSTIISTRYLGETNASIPIPTPVTGESYTTLLTTEKAGLISAIAIEITEDYL